MKAGVIDQVIGRVSVCELSAQTMSCHGFLVYICPRSIYFISFILFNLCNSACLLHPLRGKLLQTRVAIFYLLLFPPLHPRLPPAVLFISRSPLE